MIPDTQLVAHLHEIIRSSDLRTTTATAVCSRLEADLGVDLSRRRMFIVEEIDKFLHDGAWSGEADEKENGKKRIVTNKSVKTRDSQNKNALQRPCALSPQLRKLFGVAELARTEVVKKLWAYIKEHNLQSPKDRRMIMCDNALYGVFRVRKINMFNMIKELSPHISSLDEAKETHRVKSSAKGSQMKEKRQASPAKSSQKENQRKIRRQIDRPEKKEKSSSKCGIASPTPISDNLVKFIGTGELELSRTETVKRLWKYIKENNLQDPSDKWIVLCDDKLKQLLEVDTFNGLALSTLLNPHFVKKN